jgi:hypothetical protein
MTAWERPRFFDSSFERRCTMNKGSEREAIETILSVLSPIRIESGQKFADDQGRELFLVGFSRSSFCSEIVAVLNSSGLRKGMSYPDFQVKECVGLVMIESEKATALDTPTRGPAIAPHFVATAVYADRIDEFGRCIVRPVTTETEETDRTGETVIRRKYHRARYPLLISAGVSD